MILKSLELLDYRNYHELKIEFHSGTNILFGDNAQGKTNLLESIYLCGTTKSHRGVKDRELIRHDQTEAHIRVHIEKNGIQHKIDMHLKKNKPKGVAIDGIPIKKQSELFGMLNLVFFSPEDLSIIKSGPSERRRFIDLELCQIDKIYLHYLTNYNKVLVQRNNLLKQISFNRNLLDTLYIWDEKLIEYGSKVIELRTKFIEKLNLLVKEIHEEITSGKEVVNVEYSQNVTIEAYKTRLEQSRDRDIVLGTTNVGPHRDDLNFLIGDFDIRKYGSQGQQRTVALSLKLAEIKLVKSVIGQNPILLLDDVLSELDRNRQIELLNNIGGIQTIITCTGMEEFVNLRFEYNKILHVANGTVVSVNEIE